MQRRVDRQRVESRSVLAALLLCGAATGCAGSSGGGTTPDAGKVPQDAAADAGGSTTRDGGSTGRGSSSGSSSGSGSGGTSGSGSGASSDSGVASDSRVASDSGADGGSLNGVALPVLPRATVDLTPPNQGTSPCPTLTTGGNCVRNVPAGDATSFQAALNAATCGDTIVLKAGSTYTGNFTVPATTCASASGWMVIASSALSSLPQPGNRVGPSNASEMPVISTPNVSPALSFLPSSSHWRVVGAEITTSYVSTNTLYWLVGLGFAASTNVASTALLPSYVILDRTWVHGSSTTPIQHGVYANAASFGWVDSTCDSIVDSGADAQCFLSTNGVGPYLLQNNLFEATGENVLFGGADPAIANLVPSDITIVGNLFEKDTAWRASISDVKNHFELKNAQRLLLEGNVLEHRSV